MHLWPTVLQLWRFSGCFFVACVDVVLESNYIVRRCVCLKRWLSGWRWQDNVGANFALLVVTTNWCLPPPHIPPFPSSKRLFPFPSLFYLLTSSYATFNYAIHFSVIVNPSFLFWRPHSSHTFSLPPSITSTLTLRVAFNSALFRFPVTVTLNLQRLSVTQLCHFHLPVLKIKKKNIVHMCKECRFSKRW